MEECGGVVWAEYKVIFISSRIQICECREKVCTRNNLILDGENLWFY